MRPILGLVTGLALVCSASACSDDDSAAVTGDVDDSAAVTGDVDDGGAGPSIVSMSPTATETLFAIGAGDLVVAVDDQSTFPPDAPMTDLSGFGASVEAIAEYEPGLVVMWFDPGDVQAGLEALGIEVLFQPAALTLSDVYSQIEQLGVATGHVGEAAELVSAMQTRLGELADAAPAPETPLTYYHEVDNTYYSITSSTFYGELYGLFGLQSIADPADPDGSAFGYPQLSEEFIIDADPDLVFLADVAFGESAATVAGRPGWDTLTAVQTGAVVELDSEVAGRWGPRVVDYAESVAAAIDSLVPA